MSRSAVHKFIGDSPDPVAGPAVDGIDDDEGAPPPMPGGSLQIETPQQLEQARQQALAARNRAMASVTAEQRAECLKVASSLPHKSVAELIENARALVAFIVEGAG